MTDLTQKLKNFSSQLNSLIIEADGIYDGISKDKPNLLEEHQQLIAAILDTSHKLTQSLSPILPLVTSTLKEQTKENSPRTYDKIQKRLTDSGNLRLKQTKTIPQPLPRLHKLFSALVDDPIHDPIIESEDKTEIEAKRKELEELVENERIRQIKEESNILAEITSNKRMTNIVKTIRGEVDSNIFTKSGRIKIQNKEGDEIGDKHIWKYLEKFRQSETLNDILSNWNILKQCTQTKPGENVYKILKSKIGSGTPFWYKSMCQNFTKRESHVDYQSPNTKNKIVVIVGAGPAGLATAIECSMLGATVYILEKRDYITRNNILHLWPYTVDYLKNLSAKTFYTKFGTGSIDHIGTKQIQRVLLKIALLMGVTVYYGTSYEKSIQSPDDNKYHVLTNPPIDIQPFDLLVAADGERSMVAKEFGFARKEFSGSLAIGITFNFVNKNTPEEVTLREFGIAKQFAQQYFKYLLSEHNIDLENLVYYRGETHYFVMTAKKENLIRRSVLKSDPSEPSQLVQSENISIPDLISYVRDVATYVGIPPQNQIVTNQQSKPDIAIFDFSRRLMADEASKVLPSKQYVSLAGDALLEPFWPLGTGCNRALLSALDTAWMLKDISTLSDSCQIIKNRYDSYVKMKNSLGGSISQPYSKCSLDPLSRYGSGKDFPGI